MSLNLIIQLIGISIIVIALLVGITKPRKGIPLAVFTLVGSFNIEFIDYNFVAKFLVVLLCGYSLWVYGHKHNLGLIPFALIIIFFMTELVLNFNRFNQEYGMIDLCTSFATIFLGFFLVYIKWSDESRINALKILSWSATLAFLFGFIEKQAVFVNGRIVTIGLYSQLPFWGGVGIYSSILLKKLYSNKKYEKFIYINFIIIMLTQSRGGAIFAFIAIAPYLYELIRHINKKFIMQIIFITPIAIYFIYLAIQTLLERTFSTGSFNSTNRLEAWTHLLDLSSSNRMFGMGIGSLKTVMGDYIINQGFNAAHNEYIRFLYESGIAGLILIGLALFFVFKSVLRDYCLNEKKYVSFMILGFLVYSITDNTISAGEFWAPFMLSMSLSFDLNSERIKLYGKKISKCRYSSI